MRWWTGELIGQNSTKAATCEHQCQRVGGTDHDCVMGAKGREDSVAVWQML